MNQTPETKIKQKINNIDITINKTKKFTNVLLNIAFICNFSDEWPYLQFISEMVTKCNNVYPTMEAQYQYLYNLYGTAIYASKFSNYKTMGIKFTLDVVNQSIIQDNSLYDECFNALENVIYNPHTKINKDGQIEFDQKDLNEVKNNCINEIINEANDKRRYANYRFLKKMSKKDEFPLTMKQTIASVKNVKSVDVYRFYQELLHNSKVAISIVGDVDEDFAKKLVEKLHLKSCSIELEYEDKQTKMNVKKQRVTEKASINQAHIYMGYRTDILYRDSLYPAYLLFNIMFGELPSSTLFSQIREEQGLAYSVYSSIFPVRNYLYIYAGVDNEKIELSIKSIKKQLAMYQNGDLLKNRDYFEVLLNAAKNELKNEYINSLDSQASILVSDIKDAIVTRRSLKELYEDASAATLEDIIEASRHLALDTTYVLKGENTNE